ncbi:DUF6053 domain-containing protein [Lysobacter sp. CA199]
MGGPSGPTLFDQIAAD